MRYLSLSLLLRSLRIMPATGFGLMALVSAALIHAGADDSRPAAARAGLYGLTETRSGLSLMSVDVNGGNLTLIGSRPLSGMKVAMGDLRAIDQKRGVYYFLGATSAGAPGSDRWNGSLVGLDLHTGAVTCRSALPLADIGIFDMGQSLVLDTVRDRLIISGVVGNSTSGYFHQILTASLSGLPSSSGGSADGSPAECSPFTKGGTFGLAKTFPIFHSSTYNDATQTMYVTVMSNKTAFALAVIDLAAQRVDKVVIECGDIHTACVLPQLYGMEWDSDSGTLIGLMQNFGGPPPPAQAENGDGNGNGINLMSLDPSGAVPTWTVRRLANLGAPNWDVMGNSGDVHSYDTETGMFYAVFASGEDNPVRIAKIDWAAGWLLSNPLVENSGKPVTTAVMQLAFAGGKLKSDDDETATASSFFSGPSLCQTFNDTDLLGASGGLPYVRNVTSVAQCCALCAAHTKCRAWVLHPPGYTTGGFPATCFLKITSAVKHTSTTGVIAGVYAGHGPPSPAPPPPPPPPPPPNCTVPTCGPAAAAYPVPPGPQSTYITATIAFNETIYTGVPSDTWPSVWRADGKSFGMGGDMPGSGLFKCVDPHKPPSRHGRNHSNQNSFTNSFSYTKTADGGVKMALLNCTAGTSSLQEVYDVCSGGKAGSVFAAPNLKPVSMLTLDDNPSRIYAFVQCTYEGPCLHDSDDPLACGDPTYPACQRGVNTWLVSSADGYQWQKESAYNLWTGRLTGPMFISAGKAYASAPDDYAYVHFPVSANIEGNGTERSCWYGNDYLLLARVKRTLSAVRNRSAYEWWTGAGKPWVADDSKAAKHFEYHHMIGAPHTFYNAGLKRYILPNYGSVNSNTKYPWSETAGNGKAAGRSFPSQYATCTGAACPYHSTQLTLYEAEHPWGPWQQFYFQSEFEWGGDGPQGAGHTGAPDDTYSSGAYSPDFPAEWISEDGTTMMMVSTSCCNFSTSDPSGLIPKAGGYQAHWTPVKISMKS